MGNTVEFVEGSELGKDVDGCAVGVVVGWKLGAAVANEVRRNFDGVQDAKKVGVEFVGIKDGSDVDCSLGETVGEVMGPFVGLRMMTDGL